MQDSRGLGDAECDERVGVHTIDTKPVHLVITEKGSESNVVAAIRPPTDDKREGGGDNQGMGKQGLHNNRTTEFM